MHRRVKKIDFLSTLNKIYGDFEKVMQFMRGLLKTKTYTAFSYLNLACIIFVAEWK